MSFNNGVMKDDWFDKMCDFYMYFAICVFVLMFLYVFVGAIAWLLCLFYVC